MNKECEQCGNLVLQRKKALNILCCDQCGAYYTKDTREVDGWTFSGHMDPGFVTTAKK